jgi:threonine synthase
MTAGSSFESTQRQLECSWPGCSTTLSHWHPQHLCTECGSPLLARYDLADARRSFHLAALANRTHSIWRYREVMPPCAPVSLGEGMTPLIRLADYGRTIGIDRLYVKDEGLNPTGSFKARGLSAAVSMAKALGQNTIALPTAGNAGGAAAAYAARAGIKCVIAMPADTPTANVIEARAFGADVRMIDGLISDCGKFIAEQVAEQGWYDVSTLKEPYRIEGKKTMGYELWEDFGGRLPDVIVYPTGGGVGLIGMWKAFEELEVMGQIGRERPRMIAVQAEGCAPIVKAFEADRDVSDYWEGAETVASGLRVPKALGDFIVLADVYASGGEAVAVSDGELMASARELAAREGIFAAPEGAAGLAAVQRLRAQHKISADDTVVAFNTGSGYKYLEAWRSSLEE